ncbi:hypothetical protein FRB94_013004 [Tulasnella sp. JGI-2019a]|nr:hypothetical protein FRB93_001731 [Tulasnella sp. JGI-2019a]KAG9008779.1 hypothetical protein FRB94_013004 [Tulasnella sp. JGI-2019a]KAG9033968.1 hypothetical protein FRB95_014048 [Tulasnella sp. JGI-2019a]
MEKRWIIVFRADAPASVMDTCIKELEKPGVNIQRFDLIKGFAATIPDSSITDLQASFAQYIAYVEPDQTVHTYA